MTAQSRRDIAEEHRRALASHAGAWGRSRVAMFLPRQMLGEVILASGISCPLGQDPLKHTGLRFVTDEPIRADLRQGPRGHRRPHPHQLLES